MIERLHMVVSGRVQGVWFRASTEREARRLGLVGEVWNRVDGRVEIIAEGERGDLRKLLAWAEVGPAGARVTGCRAQFQPASASYSQFSISG